MITRTKIFNAAFGSLIADKADTDCKSAGFISLDVTEKSWKEYKYRFVIEKDSLVELNNDTYKNYLGKTIKLRSPLFCTTRHVCNKCLGNMFYKLKVRYIGLHASRITSALMNAAMKQFHNMSVEPEQFNLLDYVEKLK